MKIQSTLITTLLSAVFAVTLSSQAAAQSFRHIDQLVSQLECQARELVDDVSMFKHTHQYEHLVLAALDMRQSAMKMHDVIHLTGNLTHMEVSLAQLEGKYYHFKGLFHAVEHSPTCGHSRFHRPITIVKNKLYELKTNIDQARDELRYLRSVGYCPSKYRHTVTRTEVYRAPVVHEQYVYRQHVYGGAHQYHDQYAGHHRRSQSSHNHGHYGHSPYNNHRSAHDYYGRDQGGISLSIGGGSSKFTFRF